ncbi:MAG: dual specificity protein phosphatase family protein [Caldisphaeraceae archaeon]|nr:dual specificity protein phosphatase family protein [Caldisphaeraceae archaeon]
MPSMIVDNLYAGPGCIDLSTYGIYPDAVISLEPACSVEGVFKKRFELYVKDFDVEPVKNVGKALRLVKELLKKGEELYVHCRAGCGRTGVVIISCLMLCMDMKLMDALELFYAKRKCGPDSMPQEIFLEAVYRLRKKGLESNAIINYMEASETLQDFLQLAGSET